MTRILDGAVGTELARRGFALGEPSFSAAAIEAAPELLRAIHRDYVEAGAELLVAGTTCVHRCWVGEHSGALARTAVAIARGAAARRRVQVAGALAMIPPRVAVDERAAQYEETAAALAEAGVDVIVCESFVEPDELALAARACARFDGPRWGAIVPKDDGTPLAGGSIEQVLTLGFDVVGVHCCSLVAATAAIERLRSTAPTQALAAYPALAPADAPRFAATLAELAARHSLAWVGGCCGTTPATIAGLRAAIPR